MALIACALVGGAPSAASAEAASSVSASAARHCKPVKNPYEGSRYEGTDLSRIRAVRVSCKRARRVARRAHRKGLGLPQSSDGIRRFRWNGWRVRGDLRGDHDRYVARRGGKRVRWIF